MAFSINTNMASLQAQNYLRTTNDFQAKTINRVTSGLRIVQSGDDAAGLAIANSYRSDQAVLNQGIRNANDGLSQLQIIDGGMSNISQLLDRARTLATQSATGTFTGDRGVLNSEFQNVLGEISRQAQSIGLDKGGAFAKSLSVFIGGGKTNNGVDAITNGSVAVDLSKSTVDASSLGLGGVQASGTAATDIGANSATSVAKILANTTNTGSEGVSGNTVFYFNGPGFSGANKVGISVNLSGVTDTGTLVTAINQAIQNAGNNGGSQYATAFKNANITAAINTDGTGKQQLTFNASSAAFQVEAGDQVANAFMGNFSGGSTGQTLQNTVSGGANAALDSTTFGATGAGSVVVRIQGGGLASPKDLTLTMTAAETVGQAITSLTSAVAADGDLQAAGITVAAHTSNTAIQFVSKRGEAFQVMVAGDLQNELGMGSFQSGATATHFDNTTFNTGAATYAVGASTFEISLAGGTAVSGSITTTAATQTDALNQLNNLFATNASFSAAGLKATSTDATHIAITSQNGTDFRFNGLTDAAGLGISTSGIASSGTTASSLTAKSTFDSGGASVSGVGGTQSASGAAGQGAFSFGAIRLGTDTQALTITSPDATGSEHTVNVTLNASNANSLDMAIATINDQLQQSNDPTLQGMVAVKEQRTENGNQVEGLRFISTNSSFKVSVGKVSSSTSSSLVGIGEDTANYNVAATYSQGDVYSSMTSSGGGTADISNQSTAQSAVTALANAVSTLGTAQAVVGRGENQFNYAVNLASSQVTNEAAAESRIRDADLASEAANMTKAQILLQAGIAALAQANSAPQQVLTLLRG